MALPVLVVLVSGRESWLVVVVAAALVFLRRMYSAEVLVAAAVLRMM